MKQRTTFGIMILLSLVLISCGSDRAKTIELPPATEESSAVDVTVESALEPTDTPTPTVEAATATPKPTDVIPTDTPTMVPPTPTDEPPTETPTTEPKTYTPDELLEGLLTLQDLPTGWTMTSIGPSDSEGDTHTFMCREVESRGVASVIAEFEMSQFGPRLHHYITAYPEGVAGEALEEMIEVSQSCLEWTTTENGNTMTWTLTPLSFPNLGDETFALRISTNLGILGPIEIDSIFVRTGDVITAIAYTAIGPEGVDTTVTEELMRVALRKVEDLD